MEEGNKDTGTEVVFELEEQPEARGPPGTVPVARRDVADTLGDEELPRSVKDFLSKYGDASDETVPGPDAEGGGRRRLAPGRHEYVSTHEYADIFGGSGKINAWNPYVYKSSEFSLGRPLSFVATPCRPSKLDGKISETSMETIIHIFSSFTGPRGLLLEIMSEGTTAMSTVGSK